MPLSSQRRREPGLSCCSPPSRRTQQSEPPRLQIQIQITHPPTGREPAIHGAGGAVAGEVPAGRGDHDGRRRAPARLHDLPQQALLLRILLRRLLHRLRRPLLLLLQADVGVLCLPHPSTRLRSGDPPPPPL